MGYEAYLSEEWLHDHLLALSNNIVQGYKIWGVGMKLELSNMNASVLHKAINHRPIVLVFKDSIEVRVLMNIKKQIEGGWV